MVPARVCVLCSILKVMSARGQTDGGSGGRCCDLCGELKRFCGCAELLAEQPSTVQAQPAPPPPLVAPCIVGTDLTKEDRLADARLLIAGHPSKLVAQRKFQSQRANTVHKSYMDDTPWTAPELAAAIFIADPAAGGTAIDAMRAFGVFNRLESTARARLRSLQEELRVLVNEPNWPISAQFTELKNLFSTPPV